MLSLSYDLNGEFLAQIRFTSRAEGDFADSPGVSERRKMVADLPWTHLQQPHGKRVLKVLKPGRPDDVGADAAVTTAPSAVLSVRTADCAAVALVSRSGVLGVVHAGWQGAAAGVIAAAVHSTRRLADENPEDLKAFISPCIHPECYEFDPIILNDLANLFGSSVRSETAWGTPALSLPELVKSALLASGVTDFTETRSCTACDAETWYSHRARKDPQRHAMAVWLEEKSITG